MDKKEKIEFWLNEAKRDFEMIDYLYKDRKYAYALFFGQLALEKLLKAVYIEKKDSSPPYIHNLTRIAQKAGLKVSEDVALDLDEITGFNVNARYDDYKRSFFYRADAKYGSRFVKKIKNIKKWLEKQI